MSIIIKYFFTISCILVIFAIIRVLYKQREFSYVNPLFWMNTLSFAYFSLPCLLIEEISFYYNWNLTQMSIDYTRVLICIINLMNTIFLLLVKKVNLKLEIYNNKLNKFVKLLWFCIVSYLIFVIIKKICNNELFTFSIYGINPYRDNFKIKNLAYFLLTFSTLLYFQTSNFLCFLPNLLAFFIEICSGARTLAFIVAMPVSAVVLIVFCAIWYKRLQITLSTIYLIIGGCLTAMLFTNFYYWWITAMIGGMLIVLTIILFMIVLSKVNK